MIIGQGLRLTLVGTAIGLALSFATAQLLRSRMINVDPADPRILVGIIGVVIAVSLVASYLPGRRAAKLDPMNALRAE
jgi:putative ABC transport system permease protein